MNENTRKLWQTASQLFAMSILEICPKIIFKSIRADYLGFHLDFLLDDVIKKDQIDHAISRMKVRKKIQEVEMVSKNVVEYMKYQKQPVRAKSVNLSQQFTKVVKIDDVYADVLEGEIDTNLEHVVAVEISMPELIGEDVFRKQKTNLYRINGLAFETHQELKAHKKMCRKNSEFDHRKIPFEGDAILLWRSIYETITEVLSKNNMVEVWQGQDLEKGQFAMADEELDSKEKFGLKANGRFRGIKFSLSSDVNSLKEKLQEALPIQEETDMYGIKWPLIEVDEVGKIWIDRIVALVIEEKCVSKKPFFSKVVTK